MFNGYFDVSRAPKGSSKHVNYFSDKVIYFLLLDRKKRKPSYEDDTEIMVRARYNEK